jgi:hypothetical protein
MKEKGSRHGQAENGASREGVSPFAMNGNGAPEQGRHNKEGTQMSAK